MDSSFFKNKKIYCKKHPKEYITQICTAPRCDFNSILICSNCIKQEVQHITMHKNFIFKVGDYLQHQNYQIDPYFANELLEKTGQIELRLKEIENLCKQDESELDKDYGAMFALFYKITDQGKSKLKEHLTVGLKNISERLGNFAKTFENMKKNKMDVREVAAVFSQLTNDRAEDFIRSVINKRMNKFAEYNTNLSSLTTELDSFSSNRPQYKRKESSKIYFKEIRENFEKNIDSLNNYFKCLLEYPNLETNYNQLTFSALNMMNREKEPSVIGGGSVLSTLRIGKLKKTEKPFVSGAEDSINTSFSFVGLKKLDMFPSTTNSKVKSALQKLGSVIYPPALDDIPGYDPNFQFSSEEPFEIEEGSVYQGQWKGRFRNGMGRQLFVDGAVYEGTWLDDAPNGFGRLIRRNGDYYEGEIRNFRAHGKGKFGTLDGYSYSGSWLNDKKNGPGEEENPMERYKYIGEFLENKFHGRGILALENGTTYDGEWEEGQFTGKGTMFDAEKNEKYVGSWKNYKKNGQGTLWLADGSVYLGSFNDDLPEGYGEFRWLDGYVYKGTWRAGMQNGTGTQINPDSSEKEGEWLEGDWLRWSTGSRNSTPMSNAE